MSGMSPVTSVAEAFGGTKLCVCIYIYIYIYTHMCMYNVYSNVYMCV